MAACRRGDAEVVSSILIGGDSIPLNSEKFTERSNFSTTGSRLRINVATA